jgi:hypothetical protein
MIEATLSGHETAALDGETWTGPGAEGDLARALIGREIDPATPPHTRSGSAASLLAGRKARPFQPGLGFVRRNLTCASGGSCGPGPGTV